MHSIPLIALVLTLCSLGCALPTTVASEATTSTVAVRSCEENIAAFNYARREKRGLGKRSIYPGLQNLTCVAAPNTPRVDYISNPPVRQDVTDGQVGVALTLDIGVMDVTTCNPLPNVMVEIWSSNAVGEYGSFLRGAYTSTTTGIAEFQTIFPGYTSDSANHINVMVHTSASSSAAVSHIGQIFFTDRWTDVVGQYMNYAENANTRILNAQDLNYALANSAGYSAIVDIESINDDWPEGVVGYITVGVNPSRIVE